MTQNILITGASGDIGHAIARELAERRYQLILHYHTNKNRIMAMMDELPQESILSIIQANLETDTGLDKLIADIAFPVDGIVFANGQAYVSLLQDTPDNIMSDMYMQHIKTPWKVTKKFLPEMIRKQSGRILLITSIWGERGSSNEVIYSSAKGAQNSFIKALAKEVTASGVFVNGVSPGYIDTKMNTHLSGEEVRAVIDSIPMGRAGKSSDVADVVCFLMEQETTYMNGEIIHVNGGW